MVWRPSSLTESIDGKPLVTDVTDLFFLNFPYHRLPESNILRLCLRPEGILSLLVFYIVASGPLFKFLRRFIDSKALWFRLSIATHNLCLAVFSAVVAWNTYPIVYHHLRMEGLYNTYCDPKGTLWGTEHGFGSWSLIFYISKYYEFIDTWILILKGKNPSFLQKYHHTGIAFCMWIGVVSQSTSWFIYLVLFNSVIHTLMYTYFFLKTLYPTMRINNVAKNLTRAQITQFIAGVSFSSGVLFLGDECDSRSSRFGLYCAIAYCAGLIHLFVSFAVRKYSTTTSSPRKDK